MSSPPPNWDLNWDPMDGDSSDDSTDESIAEIDELEEEIMKHMLRLTKLVQQHQSSSNPRNKRRYYNRDHAAGHDRLAADNFSDDPVFPDDIFRRRFRIRKELFLRIVNALQSRYEYFQQRENTAKMTSLSTLQKCTGHSTIGICYTGGHNG
ncbi:PREDICTED: uncharacterized protein LOC109184590 [Ipomoea nil]|uniref:uncharacterized protein LOC109184590 n=1 Tax=Ipomoea nil TaxID=35883 RepID=UPI000900EE98|nr:PREDICTED: uncharacterized protein LOC109184590 [Ipomoea nil]